MPAPMTTHRSGRRRSLTGPLWAVGRAFAGTGLDGARLRCRADAHRGYRTSMIPDRYVLSGTDVAIPPLGVGTWAWGDRSTWGMGGYDTELTRDSIRDAWDASIDAGVTFFDTAEIYGKGESERIIGALRSKDPGRADEAVIATKFMPFPWKVNVGAALMKSLKASVDRLGVARSTSTRSTVRSVSVRMPPWPRRWLRHTRPGWSRRWAYPTTRPPRPAR